jgi:hypothetical protein
MRFVGLLVLATCSAPPVERPAPATDLHAIEHVESCPGARATWRGKREDGNDVYSTLTLVADAGKPITIDLEDVPRANWSFSIFSPDCQRVLLLLSRGGPYHVVRLDRLARYAAGEPPELELHGNPDAKAGVGAGNLRDGSWNSNTEISYAWGCCDPPTVERMVIPQR